MRGLLQNLLLEDHVHTRSEYYCKDDDVQEFRGTITRFSEYIVISVATLFCDTNSFL